MTAVVMKFRTFKKQIGCTWVWFMGVWFPVPDIEISKVGNYDGSSLVKVAQLRVAQLRVAQIIIDTGSQLSGFFSLSLSVPEL